jgi:hypothetical protein
MGRDGRNHVCVARAPWAPESMSWTLAATPDTNTARRADSGMSGRLCDDVYPIPSGVLARNLRGGTREQQEARRLGTQAGGTRRQSPVGDPM